MPLQIGAPDVALRARHDPERRQLRHHDHLHALPGHDHVPDADLYLEHPAHQHAGAAGIPGARRDYR
jgi:hypothetical protein